MMNDIMTKIWENPNYVEQKINSIKETPVKENIFDQVIKKGIGQE